MNDRVLRRTEWLWFAILCAAFMLLHLSSGHPFHRALIDLDDRAYVGGLDGVSLREYFTDRMWRPNSLAFPIRDLTFLFDNAASHALGIQTYILTSALLFLAYALLAWRWLRRSIPVPVALLILSVVVMHPANVEIVQWVISRKHLLVGIWLMSGAILVSRVVDEERPPTPWEWIGLFVLYGLSLLSHPTGALFPVWVCLMVFAQCRANGRLLPLLGWLIATALIGWLWLGHVTEDNADYRGLVDQTGYAVEGWSEKARYLLLGVGRGTWQLLLPFNQAVYFNIDSMRNRSGLLLLVGSAVALGTLAVRARRKAEAQSNASLRGAAQVLLLAALLFAPEAAFISKRSDFVMADRFLFLSLPYLLAGVVHLLSAYRSSWIEWLTPARSALVAAGVVGVYVIPSAAAAPRWETEQGLYTSCVQSEGSDRCWFHYVSKLLESGCWEVAKQFDPLRTELTRSAHRTTRTLYRGEGGLVLSLCMASATGQGVAQRSHEIDELVGDGATEESLTFARNLLSIEESRPLDALYRTTTRFLMADANTSRMSQAMLGALEGQFTVINMLPDAQARGSGPALETFKQRYASSQISPSAISLGSNMTLQALAKAHPANPVRGQEPHP